MWVIAAFLALGFLVGQLVGLSASSVTSAVLGFLFAFGGGTAIGFMKGLEPGERTLAAQAIFALCVSCLAGIYAGIYVSEQQLLTRHPAVSGTRLTITDRKYVRENILKPAQAIDQRLANKNITVRQAYDELYDLVSREGASK